MSENPADSLRRELEAAAHKAIAENDARWPGNTRSAAVGVALRAIWPFVLAALEAARADEREKIAKAVENDPHNGWVQSITDSGSHSRQRTPKKWAEFVRAVSDGD